jgi:hypothetical protein
MKKNAIKKMLLLTPLILGLAACDIGQRKPEGKERDFFTEPKPAEIVKELSERETVNVLNEVYIKLEQVNKLNRKGKSSNKIDNGFVEKLQVNEVIDLYTETNYDLHILEQNSLISPYGVETERNTIEQHKQNFWKDDVQYSITSVDEGNGHTHSFNRYSLTLEERDIQYVNPLFTDELEFYLSNLTMYLEKNGNYRVFSEINDYYIAAFEGTFFHQNRRTFDSIEITSKFEIINIYHSETVLNGNFKDRQYRTANELVLNEDTYHYDEWRFTYGTKKENKNVDELVASYPEAVVDHSFVKLHYYTYNCSRNEETNEITISYTAQRHNDFAIKANVTRDGGVEYRFLKERFIRIEKNQALKLYMRFRTISTPLDAPTENHDFKTGHIDPSEGVSDYLKDAMYVVEKDGIIYLAYMPTPEQGFPDYILLSVAFDYKITPVFDENNIPQGELEISNVLVFCHPL